MPERAFEAFSYHADIRGGGYRMTGLVAASEGESSLRVLAIPGAPSRFLLFQRLLSRAPAEWDVRVVMRAGYGDSGGADKSPVTSFEEQVGAIAPLLVADDPRPLVLLGVSYGGALAMKCALDHPDAVSGVVTSGMLVREPRLHVLAAASAAALPGVRHLLPRETTTARRELQARRAQVDAVFGRLSSLRQPVTILHGDRDWLISYDSALELRGMLPTDGDVVIKKVKGGSHYMECERPNMMISEIADLAQRIGRTSGRPLSEPRAALAR